MPIGLLRRPLVQQLLPCQIERGVNGQCKESLDLKKILRTVLILFVSPPLPTSKFNEIVRSFDLFTRAARRVSYRFSQLNVTCPTDSVVRGLTNDHHLDNHPFDSFQCDETSGSVVLFHRQLTPSFRSTLSTSTSHGLFSHDNPSSLTPSVSSLFALELL